MQHIAALTLNKFQCSMTSYEIHAVSTFITGSNSEPTSKVNIESYHFNWCNLIHFNLHAYEDITVNANGLWSQHERTIFHHSNIINTNNNYMVYPTIAEKLPK